MLDGKLLAGFDRDGLWVCLLALLPENKLRVNLQLLRDDGLEREDRLRTCRIVGLDGYRFNLRAGAIADIKSGGDLFPSPPWPLVPLRFFGGANTGSGEQIKMHPCLASGLVILIVG